jgi:hypothetical protein
MTSSKFELLIEGDILAGLVGRSIQWGTRFSAYCEAENLEH